LLLPLVLLCERLWFAVAVRCDGVRFVTSFAKWRFLHDDNRYHCHETA
jgi:hypothetical protein